MLITVTCPTCGFRFKVEGRYAGRQGRCPEAGCNATYKVPRVESAAPVAATRTGAVSPEVVEQRPQPRAEAVAVVEAGPVPERVSRPAPLAAERVTGPSIAATRPVESTRTRPRSRPVQRAATPSVRPAPTAAAPRSNEAPSPAPTSPQSWKRWVYPGGVAMALLSLVVLGATFLQDGSDEAAADAETQPVDPAVRQAAIEARDADLSTRFGQHVGPFLTKYCNDCHGDALAEGGLDFTKYRDVESVRGDREKWEHVEAMLAIRAMPPADHDPLPTEPERKQMLAWLDEALGVDCSLERDPGRVTIRRLNRKEYSNTVRDLVGIDFDPAKDFPSDDVGYGFDNIGDVLSLPPLLLEKYVDAAERITEAAIDVDAFEPFEKSYSDRQLLVDGRPNARGGQFVTLASSGEVQADVDWPRDGRYEVRIEASADQAGDEPARMEFKLAGRSVKTFDVTGRRKTKVYVATVEAKKGRGRVAARFVNDYYNPGAPNPNERDRNLHVGSFEVRSLDGPGRDALAATHRKLIPVRPGDGTSTREAALRALRPFAKRAFRRPVDDAELDKYVALVEMVVENGDSFERAMQIAMQGVLVSPHFLFRLEGDPAAASERELDDWELATRLSYFLWSTMPDDELFQLAEAGRLHEPDVLDAQVRRMLRDGRSRALVENFGGQWLNLGQLDEIRPDTKTFKGFDEQLKQDMKRETLAFFEWVMRQDRSVLDFLGAKKTFVNERLAEHYGIEGVRGETLREVSLDGLPRAGVLTQGSVLLLTSNPNRTSPVKRGKWIMENLLGTPPPEAPPNVPTLEEAAEANPGATLREQLELHREDPVCRSCHEQMDTLGFGFETFDAVGRFRTMDGGHAIDASGVLPSGKKFNGPVDLITLLQSEPEPFVRNLSAKMLTYALGRGLEYYDECAVDEIAENVAKGDHRFSRMVLEVVRSDPFLKRRGVEKP